jgi:tyrosyl-tRNA synthetase
MTLLEELQWRGLVQDIMPGTDELLNKERVTGYIGFDPTSDSLHIGSLVPIILLMHLQRAGHRPIALVGGATGMVGDPSGKSEERNMLSEEQIAFNVAGIEQQLRRFLNFDNTKENAAQLLNNIDWFREVRFLDFIRDTGKHITVNYMMAKDSVQRRLETGMSFTEFTYQLVQGYDFYHLWKHHGVKLQMGGSDQWGNIVTGTELIRRKDGGEAFAFTAPLVKKADGGKFGKTESGNVWLDPARTSPYRFYQFWLNTSDEDAKRNIRIFTFLPQDAILALEQEQESAPHLRALQKALAKEVTCLVHSEAEYEAAVQASGILFGENTAEALQQLSENQLLDIMDGVPRHEVSLQALEAGMPLVQALCDTGILPSRGEARKMITANGISVNKVKTADLERNLSAADLLNGKYILLQKGKKNYYLLTTA